MMHTDSPRSHVPFRPALMLGVGILAALAVLLAAPVAPAQDDEGGDDERRKKIPHPVAARWETPGFTTREMAFRQGTPQVVIWSGRQCVRRTDEHEYVFGRLPEGRVEEILQRMRDQGFEDWTEDGLRNDMRVADAGGIRLMLWDDREGDPIVHTIQRGELDRESEDGRGFAAVDELLRTTSPEKPAPWTPEEVEILLTRPRGDVPEESVQAWPLEAPDMPEHAERRGATLLFDAEDAEAVWKLRPAKIRAMHPDTHVRIGDTVWAATLRPFIRKLEPER